MNRRVDRCKVSHESPASYLNKRGFIDILITREAAGERYAVILENKVNGAADTDAQLYKYVGYLKTERNFRDVFVIYLPLRERVMPSADSLGDIRMDPLFMLIGDRSISGKRDDSFASFVRGKDFALIFNEGNAWYHYEMRQMGWDDWKTGSDQLAGELREHWKKMMEITATFPMRAVSELD